MADVTALILAGGAGRRMGGIDKGLAPMNGKPLVQHVIDAITPQVADIVISANRNLDKYRALGFRVVEDQVPGHAGPLAGIASGLASVATAFALTIPCDSPYPPLDLVSRLRSALVESGSEIAVAHDGQRLQTLHMLCSVRLRASLLDALSTGRFKAEDWVKSNDPAVVDFSRQAECFFNINNSEDLGRHH